jgi:cytochrome c biogenesis protein CcmG, thiol:disulfide interchange protein DsbE
VRLVRVGAVGVVIALACVLAWRLAHQNTKVAKAVAQGKVVQAPAFNLSALSGTGRVSLAALRGGVVVVNFWASDCGPCKKEMPQLQAASNRYAAKGVHFVGIDVLDFRTPARNFVRLHGITYAIGFDGVGDTTIAYGVANTPTTFFIDRRGRIVAHVLGPMTDSELAAHIRHALTT